MYIEQDGFWPDSMGSHTCLVLPCEYGQFKVDDGVTAKSALLAVFMGVVAVLFY